MKFKNETSRLLLLKFNKINRLIKQVNKFVSINLSMLNQFFFGWFCRIRFLRFYIGIIYSLLSMI